MQFEEKSVYIYKTWKSFDDHLIQSRPENPQYENLIFNLESYCGFSHMKKLFN